MSVCVHAESISSASVLEEGENEGAYLKIRLCRMFSASPQFCVDFDKSVEPNSFIKGLDLSLALFSQIFPQKFSY